MFSPIRRTPGKPYSCAGFELTIARQSRLLGPPEEMRPPEELHAGKCRCVLSRVGVQDDKAGIHPVFDAAAMTVEAGAFSRTSGQGRGNLLETHFGTGHPKKFFGCVKPLE